MNSNITLSFCLLLLSTLCFTAYSQNIKWPETWTRDISLKINYSGPKADSKTIFISAENSYLEESIEDRPKQNLTLSFNEAELQELLSVLKKNNVVGIKSSVLKNISPDKEIVSLTFSFAGKNYIVSNSATDQLQGNAKERFYSILNYIDKLIEKKRITAKVGFIFRFDRSIIQSGKDLQIKIINPPTDIAFKADRIPSSAVINLSPGEYEMQVQLVNPETSEVPSTEINSLKTDIKINTRKTQQIKLLLEAGQLKINW